MSGSNVDDGGMSDYQDQFEQQQANAATAPPAAPPPPAAPVAPYGSAPTGGALGAYQPRTQRGAAALDQLRAQQAPATHEVDPDAPVYGFAPTKPASKQGALKDFGDQVWASTLEMGRSVLGMVSYADRALTADPTSVAWIERQKATVADHIEKTVEGMSPEAQQAMHASIFGGTDANGQANLSPGEVGWGRYLGATVAGLVPQVALAVLPGGIAAQAAKIVAFGAMDAGGAYNAIVEQVDKATPEQMAKSPVYQHLRDQGVSDIDARKQLVASIAPSLVAAHFAVGAVAGSGVTGLATKGALGAAGRGALTRIGIGAGEGGLVMGGQSAADNALEQVAQQKTGARQDFDPHETARAFASGALGGAILGGGAGMLHGGAHPQEAQPHAPTEAGTVGVSADAAAALNEALPHPDQAVQQAMASQLPSPGMGGQGEMFQAHQMDPNAAAPQAGMPGGATQPDMFGTPAPEAPPAGQTTPPAQSDQTPQPGPTAAPPAARSTAQIQREDGVGFNEAARRRAQESAPATPDAGGSWRPLGKDEILQPGARVRMNMSGGTNEVFEPTPAPTTPTTPATPQSRTNLIRALIEAGEDPAMLRRMKIADLRSRHDALAGRTNTEGVNDAGVSSAVATTAAPPPERPDSAPAEPAGPAPEITPVPAPTPAKAGVGNYQKGHANVGGLDVEIETLKGGVRRGVGPDGKPWEAEMPAHYGYIKRGDGPDGDRLDDPHMVDPLTTTLGPHADQAEQHPVFVVDQIDPKAKMFDEHKSLVGFATKEDALKAYDGSFSDGSGPTRRGAVTEMPFDQFKDWVKTGDTKSPIAFKPTKDAELRAKRAAQKAKMAESTGRQKGVVATGELAEKPAAEPSAPRAERAPTEIASEIHEAATRAGRAEGLPPAVLKKWVADVARIVQGAKDEAGAHDALAQWGEQGRTAKIAGAKVTRAAVADHTLQLLRGRGLTRSENFRRQVVGEAERRPSVYENEGAARRADLEDKLAEGGTKVGEDEVQPAGEAAADNPTVVEGEGASQGVADYSGAERQRSAGTTDKTRILSDLLDDVTQGRKTAQEASAEYGAKEGGPGRARRFNTFADYLDERIRHAEDPDVEAKLLQTLAETHNARHDTPQAKAEATKGVERLLAETGRERAGQLRALKDELADPVGAATKREDRLAGLKEATAKRRGAKPSQPVEHLDRTEGAAILKSLRELEAKYQHAAKNSQGDNAYRAVKSDIERMKQLLDEQALGRTALLDRMLNRGSPNSPWRSARADWASVGFAELRKIGERLDDWGEKGENALDEAQTAANRTPKPLGYRAKPDGITPGSSRYVRTANDPRLNRFISDAMRASEQHGVAYTLHDALRSIVNHSGVQAELAPLRALAQRLLRIAPDIPVTTPHEAVQRGLISERQMLRDYVRNGYDGAYIPGRDYAPGNIILTHEMRGSHLEVLLHEAMHSVTAARITELMARDKSHPDLQALNAMARELQGHANTESERLRGSDLWGDLEYALSSPHELHTMLMTNPAMQEFAAGRIASPQFVHVMRELGFAPREQGRSVWRYFTDWVRRALGIKAPASVSEYTLLDHLLRPLQDITDRAVQHNARLLPDDPVLRAQAEPLFRVASGAMGRARDAVLDRLEPNSLRDTARPAVLAATTTDATVTRYRDIFRPSGNLEMPAGNPLERFRSANEAVAHRQKEFTDAFADRSQSVVRDMQALPAGDLDKLARLMNDATIGDAVLGSADKTANDHLRTTDQQAALQALQGRYAALPEASRTVYRNARDLYAEMDAQERRAELAGVLARVFPDATEAQREAFSLAGRSKAGFEKFLADPDNSAIARAYGADWTDQRAMATGVARALEAGRVRGDYFPLRRYGEYVIRHGEKGTPDYHVEMFQTRGEAEARHAELVAQDVDDLHVVDLRDRTALREIARDHPLADEIEAAMRGRPDLREHANDVRDLMNRIILKASQRADEARARRKGIQGASTDAVRVLGQDFINTAARIGYLEHGGERLRAISDMRLVAGDLAAHGSSTQAIQARQVIHELERKVATQESPGGVLAAAGRTANSFGYVQSLMSFSHMLTSSIETHTNSTAMMGARHGAGRSALALSKALAQITPTLARAGARNTLAVFGKGLKAADWNLSNAARDRLIAAGANGGYMRRLFDALDRAGLIDHTQIRELRRIASPGGPVRTTVGSVFQKFTDFMGAGAHAVDVANKSAVAKAAFDLEMRKSGGDVGRSVDYAVETVRNATPNYNLGNKARVSTSAGPLGALAAPVTQFKQYGLHMYGVLGNLAKASIHGATRDERMEARKAFAGILATHAMMAGVLTLIGDPLRYIGGLYDAVTGAAKPHDYENDVRGFLSDTFGPELGEVIARGLPHLAGIDIHRRVGLSNLLEIPGLDSFDKAGVVKMLGTALIGAAGDDAASFMGGIAKARQGDILGGLKDVAPRPVRDVLKAIGLSNQGVTDTTGKVILPAAKLSTGDVAAQAVGFQPSRVSEFREGRFAVQEARQEATTDRSKLMKAWLQAAPTDRASAMVDIRQWNAAHPMMPITVDQLVRQLAAQRKQAAQPANAFGLKLPPKAAAEFKSAGRFAVQ